MTKEENVEFSGEVLTPIMQIIDNAVTGYDVDRLKKTLEEMESQASHVGAWPMQETMDKADGMNLVNEMFSHIIDLIEIRTRQKKLALTQSNETVGDQVLREIGF